MKNAEELMKEIEAEAIAKKEAEISEYQKRQAERIKKLNNFTDTVIEKYSDVIENDLKTNGMCSFVFEDDPYRYKFKHDHVVLAGELNCYDVVCYMREKFLNLGYKIIDYGRAYITIKLPLPRY